MSTTITIACATTPEITPAQAERVSAAQAFQRDYDQSLRADETSVLTAVAAHYFGEGEPLEFELEGTRIHLLAGPEGLTLRVDEREQVVRESGVVPVDGEGRWRLGVSIQDREFRVLVHDRDAAARREFTGIAWFPIAADRIVDARFEPLVPREGEPLQTSRGVTKTLYLAGIYRFELEGRPLALQAFAYAAEPSEGEPLLIPFRDTTTGETSYGAGRYLEPNAGELVLDFNRATNPLCAYSEHYNCPMPPAFNRLDVAIEAGARAPAIDH
ncbi:DUF1684 domain-containing protein [Nannocystaceae bacterium ST9]